VQKVRQAFLSHQEEDLCILRIRKDLQAQVIFLGQIPLIPDGCGAFLRSFLHFTIVMSGTASNKGGGRFDGSAEAPFDGFITFNS